MTNTLTIALMNYISTHTNIVNLPQGETALESMFSTENKECDCDDNVSYIGMFAHEGQNYDVAVDSHYHLVCIALNGDYDDHENCHYYWVLDPEDVVIENLIEEEDDE